MARYRKKPVVIDAVQWTGYNWQQVKRFCPTAMLRTGGSIEIPTLEGVMQAQRGDWIIKGVKGELYPCKPDVFEATYEAIDAGGE